VALLTLRGLYTHEWTPDYIAWLVDGVEIRRDSGATALAFSQNATAGLQIRFNIWPEDASFGGNFSPWILPVHQYVNWVQYSSYANGASLPVLVPAVGRLVVTDQYWR
jgi:beta-glucanase (GH16 family)